MSGEFFAKYFEYIGATEAPKIYHRWSILSCVGALVGRQVWLPFGHNKIYANMYIWLVGNPGARKGTAMNCAKNLLHILKYNKISPQRLSPEMFLAQLQKMNLPNMEALSELDIEAISMDAPCEIYVVADEVADFIRGNAEFCKTLCNLWDNLPYYDHPKLHGKSVYVHQPTVNMIGGITPEDIMESVPPAAVGQGFFSRLILVHSEPTGIKIPRPPTPTEEITNEMVEELQRICAAAKGEITIATDAERLLKQIYEKFSGIDSVQFRHYNSRRHTHLLKLCILFAVLDEGTIVEGNHVLKANTLLCVTEPRMPKALGEFGKARNATVAHNILEALKTTPAAMTIKELWKLTANDLNKMEELLEVIKGLEFAEKIQRIDLGGKTGFLPLYRQRAPWFKGYTWEEKGFLYAEEMI